MVLQIFNPQRACARVTVVETSRGSESCGSGGASRVPRPVRLRETQNTGHEWVLAACMRTWNSCPNLPFVGTIIPDGKPFWSRKLRDIFHVFTNHSDATVFH